MCGIRCCKWQGSHALSVEQHSTRMTALVLVERQNVSKAFKDRYVKDKAGLLYEVGRPPKKGMATKGRKNSHPQVFG